MAHDLNEVLDLPVRRLDGFPKMAKPVLGGMLLVGVVAFIAALLGDPERAWRAYTVNWLFWTTIAQGAVMLAVAVVLARGLWARPIRRVALSFSAFLPIALLLMVPLFFVGEHLFPWYGHDLGAKSTYLNMPFLAVRNLVLVGALTWLSLRFAYWSIRPDAGLTKEEAPGRLRGLHDRLTRNWRGQEAEETRAYRKLTVIGPALALVWATAYSVVAWDFVMSLDEHWFSTLLGPYFFMGGFLGGIAITAIFSVWYRSRLGLEEVMGGPQFHDLGKLTFAFCIFWAYLFWSQFIVIWYGLLPWEQIFLVERLSQPYTALSFFVFFALFVLPFAALLGAGPKRRPKWLAGVAALVLVGLWVERYILVYPGHYHDEALLGWQEIGTALAFAALFIGSALWFATRHPIIQIWQPLVDLSMLESTEEPPGGETVSVE